MAQNRRALMVAFHYPPMRGSSGLQRSLKLANYLPEFGWKTTVLSASRNAYPDTSDDQLRDIATGVNVRRAWCLDAARHLSLKGRYPRAVAVPDRWASWWPSAVALGLYECARNRPDIIWSTYPIATAHWIGATLHRLTGIPWVADLRDSMTEDEYPRDPTVRARYRRIEANLVANAAAVIFTAPSTRRMYSERYPTATTRQWQVIPNGYDEENFTAAERLGATRGNTPGRVTLVHSGLLDPIDRDPLPFFDALSDLKRDGDISSPTLRVILRATGHDARYRPEIESRSLGDIVELAGPVSYVEALAEMLAADGLLLFQASSCNHQIPAKLYEYFRARRPILCLTDPTGDTASEARHAGIEFILPLHDRARLREGLREFLAGRVAAQRLVATEGAIASSSRKGQAEQLARVLDDVVRDRG